MSTLTTPDKQTWLAERRNGIGGSDAATIMGLNPWKSPLTLYSEKINLIEADPLDGNEAVEWGTRLEPLLADKYQEVTKRELEYPGPFTIQKSEEYPGMICTVDRFIKPYGDKPRGVWEGKTTNAYSVKEWDGQVPLAYEVQLQHNMIVTGDLWGSFSCLIGGQKFVWMDVERNERFCNVLIEQEQLFLERLRKGDPPAADGSESTKDLLRKLYPKDSGESIALPAEAHEWGTKLEEVKASMKMLEAEKDLYENLIKSAIGEASVGLLPNGSGFSYKLQTRKEYIVKESSFRVLRQIRK